MMDGEVLAKRDVAVRCQQASTHAHSHGGKHLGVREKSIARLRRSTQERWPLEGPYHSTEVRSFGENTALSDNFACPCGLCGQHIF